MLELLTPRLRLHPLERSVAEAVVAVQRQPDWAAGYPTDGDAALAGLLVQAPPGPRPQDLFTLLSLRLRSSGLLIGGAGFKGPPTDGGVEIGYGIAAEYRRQGLVTEAVRGMLAYAAPHVRLVYAHTEVANVASRGVLVAAGFVLVASDRTSGQLRYEWTSHSAGVQ